MLPVPHRAAPSPTSRHTKRCYNRASAVPPPIVSPPRCRALVDVLLTFENFFFLWRLTARRAGEQSSVIRMPNKGGLCYQRRRQWCRPSKIASPESFEWREGGRRRNKPDPTGTSRFESNEAFGTPRRVLSRARCECEQGGSSRQQLLCSPLPSI